jgi:hypothetical protein
VDAAICGAVVMVLNDDHAGAAHLVDGALGAAPPGTAGWLLPVEPLLQVSAHQQVWASPLSRLRARAT